MITTMTQRFVYVLILSSLILSACKKREPEIPEDWEVYVKIKKEIYSGLFSKDTFFDYTTFVEEKEATIHLYLTLDDYLNHQPYATAITKDSMKSKSGGSGHGALFKIPYHKIKTTDSIRLRALKNDFNSTRHDYYNNGLFKRFAIAYPSDMATNSKYTFSTTITLALTPTNLTLQVLDQGKKVEGAEVTLYENPPPSDWRYIKKTNANGEITFNLLYPRQYWFRIIKDGKTNFETITKTNGPLPDNASIKNVIQVEIK